MSGVKPGTQLADREAAARKGKEAGAGENINKNRAIGLEGTRPAAARPGEPASGRGSGAKSVNVDSHLALRASPRAVRYN